MKLIFFFLFLLLALKIHFSDTNTTPSKSFIEKTDLSALNSKTETVISKNRINPLKF